MDPADEIARLEREIAALEATEAGARKLDLAARLTASAGGAWFALTLMGLVPTDTAATLVAIAAAIGGIVVYGANRSSLREATARRAAAAARRDRLIEALAPRRVGGGPKPMLH